MPSTSESKASRTARASAASPVAAGFFAAAVWRRPVVAGFAVFVLVLVTCASADAESATASDATKIVFLNIAEIPLSKISGDAKDYFRRAGPLRADASRSAR